MSISSFDVGVETRFVKKKEQCENTLFNDVRATKNGMKLKANCLSWIFI